jgi:hypothetical protein
MLFMVRLGVLRLAPRCSHMRLMGSKQSPELHGKTGSGATGVGTEAEEEEKKLSACRGEGSVVGPLLAARALPLPGVRARCQY